MADEKVVKAISSVLVEWRQSNRNRTGSDLATRIADKLHELGLLKGEEKHALLKGDEKPAAPAAKAPESKPKASKVEGKFDKGGLVSDPKVPVIEPHRDWWRGPSSGIGGKVTGDTTS